MVPDKQLETSKAACSPGSDDFTLAALCLEALPACIEEIERLNNVKDIAYSERNKLVVCLSKVIPSHLCRHPQHDTEWEDDWRWIVCIHGKAGQMTWHIHDSELSQFTHIEEGLEHWDGHTNEEKYKRLEKALEDDHEAE